MVAPDRRNPTNLLDRCSLWLDGIQVDDSPERRWHDLVEDVAGLDARESRKPAVFLLGLDLAKVGSVYELLVGVVVNEERDGFEVRALAPSAQAERAGGV